LPAFGQQLSELVQEPVAGVVNLTAPVPDCPVTAASVAPLARVPVSDSKAMGVPAAWMAMTITSPIVAAAAAKGATFRQVNFSAETGNLAMLKRYYTTPDPESLVSG
jgi:hypothetical protein